MYHIVLYSHHTSKQNFMYLFISTIRVSNINVRPDEFGMWRERERTKSGTRWCERRYLIAKVCGFDENCDEFSKDAVMYTSTL
jgi:hypothetical protein